jgi:hypothetical protein
MLLLTIVLCRRSVKHLYTAGDFMKRRITLSFADETSNLFSYFLFHTLHFIDRTF